eukprot:m.126724 g.126724  ORF g.126724 m.126724 type:complete len:240 (-) comp9436_c0_seq1:1157-1876(-)
MTVKKAVFENKQALASALAKFVGEVSQAAVEDHGYFSVAFSGGSLPKILTSGMGDISGMDASKWKVFFADERCVPLDDDDSNYKAVFNDCLSKLNVEADNIFTIDSDVDSATAAKKYEEILVKELGDSPSFDLILLGMGPDGHTCSLFPGHPLLDEKDRIVAHIDDSPKPPPSRITLTYPTLAQSKAVVFVCAGEGKATILQQVFAEDVRDEEKLPAARVTSKGDITWFMDEPAASLLK